MSRVWCLVVLCFAVVLSVVCVSAFAQAPVAIADHEVALLPEPGASPPAASTTEQTPAAQDESPSNREFRIALLWDPTPPIGSAADLIEIAHAYGWSWDNARKAQYLRQAADAAPGSKDSTRALIKLGRVRAQTGDTAGAEAAFSEAVARRADAETQAFVTVMQQFCQMLNAKDYASAKDLLLKTAEQWGGTELGAWAAQQVGDLHRDYIVDFDAAIPYYQAAIKAYPGTLVAQEAEVGIAECLGWSYKHPMEAIAAFESALVDVTSPRLRVRAVVCLGDALNQAKEWTDAFDVLSDFIVQCPDHPAVPLARAWRSLAAARLGYWDVAVQDAQAFVDSPTGRSGHPWIHATETFLGQDAFKRGDIADAEEHFGKALAGAPDPDAKALSWAGVGHCQAARGDPRAATTSFLTAADTVRISTLRCQYLYQAALAAGSGGDRSTQSQIINQMVVEFPGSHLTTRLVGHELLPPVEP